MNEPRWHHWLVIAVIWLVLAIVIYELATPRTFECRHGLVGPSETDPNWCRELP